MSSPKVPAKPKAKRKVRAVKSQPNRAPTARQVKAAKLVSENLRKDKPEPMGKLLLQAGYSKEVSEKPTEVTKSVTFQALLDEFMPDEKLARTHNRLLETRKIEHMVFPLGPRDQDDPNLSGAEPNKPNQIEKAGVPVERTTLSDQEIKDMLEDVNCTVKRIVHGDTARHVYFWTHDAQAQKGALELAYKMKGLLAAADKPGNTFIFNKGDVVGSKYVKD